MLGFSWGEIMIVMAVALVAIGPKDLPVAIRTVTTLIRKARGMAAEFQTHVDDMMREANLADVKEEISSLRRFDFKSATMKTVDPDGTLQKTVQEVSTAAAAPAPAFVAPAPPAEPPPPDAPAIIPPEAARRAPVPAFIPPGTRRWGF
jgi:sec-independent protein translocase protein TatB